MNKIKKEILIYDGNSFKLPGVNFLNNNLFTKSVASQIGYDSLEEDIIYISSDIEGGYVDFNISTNFNLKESMFTVLKRYGVPHPFSLFRCLTSYSKFLSKYYNYNRSLPKPKDLITVRYSGSSARGVGNIVFEFEKLPEFMDIVVFNKDLPLEEITNILETKGFKRNFYGLYRDNEKAKLEEAIKTSKLFYQEVVDVKSEYRLFWHCGMHSNIGSLLIVKRENYGLCADGNKFTEHSLGRFAVATAIDNDSAATEDFECPETVKKMEAVLLKLVRLFNNEKYLMASMDIYVDKKGEVGCFEFSNEFVMDGCTDNEITKFISDYNDYLYNYKRKI